MSGSGKLRAAILVVSETASRDPSTDKCIPALQNVFSENGGEHWTADETSIVTDNAVDIQRAITQWTDCEDPVNLVVTSGGTGFTQKDVTPEVSIFFRYDVPRVIPFNFDLTLFEESHLKFVSTFIDHESNIGSGTAIAQASVWIGAYDDRYIVGSHTL